jgi:hypothetical protein
MACPHIVMSVGYLVLCGIAPSIVHRPAAIQLEYLPRYKVPMCGSCVRIACPPGEGKTSVRGGERGRKRKGKRDHTKQEVGTKGQILN